MIYRHFGGDISQTSAHRSDWLVRVAMTKTVNSYQEQRPGKSFRKHGLVVFLSGVSLQPPHVHPATRWAQLDIKGSE